jgi:hypothetical protein
MSRWNSKQIVVDANVARGSSNDRMFNPVSGNLGAQNRQCLQAIWEEKHLAVFNLTLRQEWNRHASSHAKGWLRNMEQKNRIAQEDGERFAVLADPAGACLSSEGERAALAKDFHLIQSALATGQLILSNEVRFPRFVPRPARQFKNLPPCITPVRPSRAIRAGYGSRPERKRRQIAASTSGRIVTWMATRFVLPLAGGPRLRPKGALAPPNRCQAPPPK